MAIALPQRPLTADNERRTGNRYWAVLVLGATAALVASVWSYRTNSMLLYADSRTHLNIARRVTDGLQPGFAQLGSVWLPLPNLLMVPFAAVRSFWHQGIAGAIVGGACFVYTTVRLFSLVEEVTARRLAAWCAIAIFLTNANLLYIQSTALTEPVLLAFLIGATFHMARWMRTQSARELAWAGTLTMGATLARYEGWALLAAGAVIVFAMTPRAVPRDKRVEANSLLFLLIGGFGILMWLLYNLIIFHDALYFVHSQYSAQSQQIVLQHVGLLNTKGNLLESVLTYGWAVIGDIGPVVTIAGAAAVVAVVCLPGPLRRRSVAVLALLGAPVAFNVFALWLGQSTIRVPQRPPYGIFNDRYGLVALPLAAVAIGLLVGRLRWTSIAASAVAVAAIASFAVSSPLTLREGRYGADSAARGRPEIAADYLKQHYQGGNVLADDSRASPFIFASELDLKRFVTVAFEPWYHDAMRDPAGKVSWLVASDGDAIDQNMKANPERFRSFRLVATDLPLRLYQRVP
jgi:hypothetical protein